MEYGRQSENNNNKETTGTTKQHRQRDNMWISIVCRTFCQCSLTFSQMTMLMTKSSSYRPVSCPQSTGLGRAHPGVPSAISPSQAGRQSSRNCPLRTRRMWHVTFQTIFRAVQPSKPRSRFNKTIFIQGKRIKKLLTCHITLLAAWHETQNSDADAIKTKFIQ